jgi:hypothetical protein
MAIRRKVISLYRLKLPKGIVLADDAPLAISALRRDAL